MRVVDLNRMTRSGSLSVERHAMVLGARPRVRRLATSLARRYGTLDADDLTQLAMLKVSMRPANRVLSRRVRRAHPRRRDGAPPER